MAFRPAACGYAESRPNGPLSNHILRWASASMPSLRRAGDEPAVSASPLPRSQRLRLWRASGRSLGRRWTRRASGGPRVSEGDRPTTHRCRRLIEPRLEPCSNLLRRMAAMPWSASSVLAEVSHLMREVGLRRRASCSDELELCVLRVRPQDGPEPSGSSKASMAYQRHSCSNTASNWAAVHLSTHQAGRRNQPAIRRGATAQNVGVRPASSCVAVTACAYCGLRHVHRRGQTQRTGRPVRRPFRPAGPASALASTETLGFRSTTNAVAQANVFPSGR